MPPTVIRPTSGVALIAEGVGTVFCPAHEATLSRPATKKAERWVRIIRCAEGTQPHHPETHQAVRRLVCLAADGLPVARRARCTALRPGTISAGLPSPSQLRLRRAPWTISAFNADALM